MPIDPTKFDALVKQSGITPVNSAPKKSSWYDEVTQTEKPKKGVLAELGEDIKQTGTGIKEALRKREQQAADTNEAVKTGKQGKISGMFQNIGQAAGFVSDVGGEVIKGGAKALLSEKGEESVKSGISKVVKPIVESSPVQAVMEKYNKLKETHPELAKNIDAALNIGSLALDVTGLGVAGKGAKIAKEAAETGVKKTAKNVVDATKKIIPSSETISGIKQGVKEFSERIPRGIDRAKESAKDAALKAERIRNATPAKAKAIQSGVDENIINHLDEVDEPTMKAYKETLDIADETPAMGAKRQPSVVSGELAAKQYDLINKQKQTVGKKIGEITDNLSKTEKIDMQESLGQMDDILSGQGIAPQYTKKGVKLDFSGTKYTPAERTKIQELYNLASEGGDKLSPKQIKDKDQLFSKLQREAKFEGVGDLMVDTPEGQKSLFRVFRDIYNTKLDSISPEIRDLNKQYREFSNLTDDMEDSIFKTPNFNATKSTDPAEFAKVNLRRIFGESQSSPAFEAIADKMDKVARQLGYAEATPKQVAEFAQELRKLYPEIVPKTGFTGGIKMGVKDIAEKIVNAGALNAKDKQKALRELIESHLTPKQ